MVLGIGSGSTIVYAVQRLGTSVKRGGGKPHTLLKKKVSKPVSFFLCGTGGNSCSFLISGERVKEEKLSLRCVPTSFQVRTLVEAHGHILSVIQMTSPDSLIFFYSFAGSTVDPAQQSHLVRLGNRSKG